MENVDNAEEEVLHHRSWCLERVQHAYEIGVSINFKQSDESIQQTKS